MSELDYNPIELLICTASRLMEDETTAFIGTGIPMLAASLAQRRQAPNLVPIFEFGGTGAILEDLPMAVGEARSSTEHWLHRESAISWRRLLGDSLTMDFSVAPRSIHMAI